MNKKLLSLFVGAALLAFTSAAHAVPITGLYNTGVDGAGVALAGGLNDPHYTVLENAGAQAVVMTTIPGTYVPNNAGSKWIWQQANGMPINVTRTFRTTFSLAGLDPTTASISGLWGVDNQGLDILINGVSTGNTVGGFQSLVAFNINSGFVAGVNTLDFVAKDVGFISGFRVDQISGTARELQDRPQDVSEPAGLALIGLFGLMGLAARRRK